jgi:hypothetical protein
MKKAISGTLLFAMTSMAMAMASPAAFVQNAELAEARSVLFKLDGRWKIAEQYPKSPDYPNGATGKGNASFDRSLEDNYVIGKYSSRSSDLGIRLEGHAVFTFDEATNQFRYWWFANYGSPKSFIGVYDKRGDKLVFSLEGAATGEGMRHTFAFEPDGDITFTMVTEIGVDMWNTDVTTTYSRKGKAKEADAATDTSKKKRPSRGL